MTAQDAAKVATSPVEASASDRPKSDHEIVLTRAGAEPTAPATDGGSRSWKPILRSIAVLAVGIVGFVLGALFFGESEPPPQSEEATTDAGSTIDAIRLDDVAAGTGLDRSWLAVLTDDGLSSVDAASGTLVSLGKLVPDRDTILAPFLGEVAFVSDGAVWATDDRGAARKIAEADVILPADRDERIWLGTRQPSQVDARFESADWRLLEQGGEIITSVVREAPMEYTMPDLVWGFDSSFFRLDLSSDEDDDWSRIGTGWPVAVGRRDIIINTCVRERDGDLRLRGECELHWYDRISGDDRGPLFVDLAGNFDAWYGGIISPEARLIARHPNDGAPIEITVVATGEVVASECSDTERMAWADDDTLVACATPLGFQVLSFGVERWSWEYRTASEVGGLSFGTPTRPLE